MEIKNIKSKKKTPFTSGFSIKKTITESKQDWKTCVELNYMQESFLAGIPHYELSEMK